MRRTVKIQAEMAKAEEVHGPGEYHSRDVGWRFTRTCMARCYSEPVSMLEDWIIWHGLAFSD